MFKKVTVVFVLLMIIATVAYAGVLGDIKGWISGELVALLATAGLAIMATVNKVLFSKVKRTFKEAGEFLDVVSKALEDNKISREELTEIVKSGKKILAVWE